MRIVYMLIIGLIFSTMLGCVTTDKDKMDSEANKQCVEITGDPEAYYSRKLEYYAGSKAYCITKGVAIEVLDSCASSYCLSKIGKLE